VKWAEPRWAPVALWLVMAVGFMAHGWAKLNRGPEQFGKLLGWAGVPYPAVAAWSVTLLELLGGLALFVGAFVAIESIPR
jgi:putative oxidoreductase